MKTVFFLISLILCFNTPALSDPIVLGTIFELHGRNAPTAQEALNGAILAIKKINETGRSETIRLEVKSTTGEPEDIIKTVENLCETQGIIAATGLISGDSTINAATAFQAKQLPYLSTGVQVDGIAQSIGPNIFTLAVPDIRSAQLLADFATNSIQSENIMLVGSDLSDSTARQADSFARRFKQNGGKIMAKLRITQPDADLSFITRKLKELKPAPPANSTVVTENVGVTNFADETVEISTEERQAEPAQPEVDTVVIFASPRLSADLINLMQKENLTYRIIGGTTFDTITMQENLKTYPESIYYASQASLTRESQLVKSFVTSYKELFGTPPRTGYAALGFDSIMLLAASMEQREPSAATIRNSIPAIKNFDGVSGIISFQGRAAHKPLYIMQYQAGQISQAADAE